MKWFAYATFHSTLILLLTFFTIDYISPNIQGKFGGVWVDGAFIFCMLVLVANLKILISSYLITGWLLFFVLGSTIFYFLCFWVVSVYAPMENDYYSMQNMFTFPQSYLFSVFFCSGYILLDMGLHYVKIELNTLY